MSISDRNIVLCGFMGAGKSEVGRLLADELSRQLVDTDALIEEEAGLTISEIFRRYGEKHFRQLERCQLVMLKGKRRLVVASGGGTLADPANLADLRADGVIFYLKAEFAKLMERVGKGGTRPLISGAGSEQVLRRLLEERERIYCQADFVVDTSHLRPGEVSGMVIKLFSDLT